MSLSDVLLLRTKGFNKIPSLFFFRKSEWREAQKFLFKQNEEQEG